MNRIKNLATYYKKTALLNFLCEPEVLQEIERRDPSRVDLLQELVLRGKKAHFKYSKRSWISKTTQGSSVKIKDLPTDSSKKIGAFYHYAQESRNSLVESYALCFLQELIKSPQLLENTLSKLQIGEWQLSSELSTKIIDQLITLRSRPDQLYEQVEQGSLIKEVKLLLEHLMKEEKTKSFEEQVLFFNQKLEIDAPLCSSKKIDPSFLEKGSFLYLEGKQCVFVNLPHSFSYFNEKMARDRKSDELFAVVTNRKEIKTSKMRAISLRRHSILKGMKKNVAYLSLCLSSLLLGLFLGKIIQNALMNLGDYAKLNLNSQSQTFLSRYPKLNLNPQSQTFLSRNSNFGNKIYDSRWNIDSCAIENILSSFQTRDESAQRADLKKVSALLCRTQNDPENIGLVALRDLQKLLNQNEKGFLQWENLEKIDQSLNWMGGSLNEAKHYLPEGFENQELEWKIHVEGAQEEVRQLQSKLNETRLLLFTEGSNQPVEAAEKIEGSQTSKKGGWIEEIKKESPNFLKGATLKERDTIALHVLGDGFGKESGLEGAPSGYMIQYLQKILSTRLLDEEFAAEETSLKNKETLISNLDRFQSFNALRKKDLGSFVKKMRGELDQLRNGETLLLDGGWRNINSGHAMLYEIIKINPNQYNFRIYNTGAGLEFHSEVQAGYDQWALPVREFANVNLKTLTSKTFWHTFNKLRDNPNDFWKASLIYEHIIGALEPSKEVSSFPATSLFPPQNSGTCSYRVLMAYLYGLFENKNQFHRAEFKIKFQTLLEYAENTSLEDFVQNEQKRKLIEKATNFFSRDLIRLYQNNILSQSEFEEVSHYVLKLATDLSISEMEVAKRYKNQFAEVQLDPKNEVNTENIYAFGNAPSPDEGKTQRLDKNYVTRFIQEMPLREGHFQSDLEGIMDHLNLLYSGGEVKTVVSSVRELTSRLRVSKGDKENHIDMAHRISKFTLEESEEFAHKLREISLIHFKSLGKDVRRKSVIDPSTALSQIKLSVLAHLTMNRFLKLKGLKAQNFISSAFAEMVEGRNIYMLLYTLSEDEELKELDLFLRENKVHASSFFDINFSELGWALNLFPEYNQIDQIPLVKWDYLNTKEFQDKFNRLHDKKFYEYSEGDRIKKTYEDSSEKEKMLPPIFYNIRDLEAVSFAMTRGVRGGLHNLNIDLYKENSEIAFILGAKYLALRIFNDLFGYENGFFSLIPSRKKVSTISNHLDQGEEGRKRFNEIAIYCPHKNLYTDNTAKLIGHQKLREIGTLNLEENLQIVNTLGYFKNEQYALKDPGMRGSFEELIFDRDILLHDLTLSKAQSQTLINQFRNFFQSGLEINLSLKDFDTAIYFIENAVRLQRIINEIGAEYPQYGADAPQLFDISKKIKSILKHPTLSLSQKTQLQAHLMMHLSNQKMSSLSEMSDFISAWISVQSETQTESLLSPQTYTDLLPGVENGLRQLYYFLNENDPKILMNEILKHVLPNFPAVLDWEKKAPFVFESKDRKIIVDLKEGSFSLEGSQLSGLDLSVQNHPIFQALFSESPPVAVTRSGKYLELTTQEGVRFGVHTIGERYGIFERFHQGSWYSLSTKPDYLNEKEKHIPNFFWSPPLMSALYKELDSFEEIFFDRQTHAIKYRLIGSDQSGLLDKKIQKLNSTDSHLPTHDLVDFEKIITIKNEGRSFSEQRNYPEILEWLSLLRFESIDFLLIWKSIAQQKVNLIELPRYNLTFDLEGDGENFKFASKEYKGFHISKTQYLDEFEAFGQYLVLENKFGKKIVLLPQRSLGDPSNSLESDFPYLQVEKKENELSKGVSPLKPYSILNLNRKGKIDFSLLSKEEKLHLSEVYFTQHQFEKANDLLSLCKSGGSPLSQEALFHLHNTINLRGMSDPRALFIKLKAASLIAKNNLDFFIQNAELESNILDLYQQYLAKSDGFHKYELTRFEEESLIYEFLNHKEVQEDSSTFDNLLKRLEVLNGPQYDQVLSHYALSNLSSSFIKDKPFKRNYLVLDSNWGVYLSKEALRSLFTTRDISLKGLFFLDCRTGQEEIYQHKSKSFTELYRIIKDSSMTLKDKKESIKSKFHLDLTSCCTDLEFYDELKVAFKLMLQNKKEVNHSIIVLNAVLNAPEAFPKFEDFKKMVSDIEKFQDENIYIFIRKSDDFFDTNTVFQQVEEGVLKYYSQVAQKASFESDLSSKGIDFKGIAKKSAKVELPKKLPIEKDLYLGELSLEDPLVLSDFFESFSQYEEIPPIEFIVNSDNNPLAVKELSIFHDGVKKYSASLRQPKLEEPSLAQLREMHRHFAIEVQDKGVQLRRVQFDLLRVANRLPEDSTQLALTKAHLAGDLSKRVSLKELKLLFLESDLNAYKRANPYLTEEDCEEIHSQMKTLLITSTYVQQLDRSIEALTHYLGSESVDREDKTHRLKELKEVLTSNRHYKADNYPEFLVFEEALGVLLRKDQVENIQKLLDHSAPNTVLEMVVGAGKTYILSPLIAKRNANGQNLSLLMMPEELFPSMSKEIELSLGASFQSQVQSFHFDRNTQLDSKKLRWILKQLQECIKEKKILMITPKSIQSFYLMAKEALLRFERVSEEESEGLFKSIQGVYQMAKEFFLGSEEVSDKKSEALFEEIQLYKKIFELFKTKGNVLIDEMDLVLHPLKEHHFTYKSLAPNHEILHHMGDVYRFLIESFKPLIELHTQKREQVFSIEKYNREYKPKLIEALLSGSFTQNDSKLKDFISENSKNRESISDFLEDKIDGTIFSSASPYVKDRLAMAKEMIQSLLPLTLSKSANEHYGLSQKDKKLSIAIPYHGSNHPAEGSRFGTFYEATAYTYQYYLEEGIPKELILSAVEELLSQFSKEFKGLKKEANLEEIKKLPSFQTFAKLSPKLNNLDYFTNIKAHLDHVQYILNEDPQAILNFVESFIVSKMEIFSEHIQVGPQLYDWMFQRVNGFTGTLWNFEAFPEGMAAHYSSEASGKILSLLSMKSSEGVHLSKSSSSLDQILNSILGGEIENAQAIIDAGAYFKGFSGEEVARALLHNKRLSERKTPIKGIVFYDKEDKLQVLEKINGHTQIIEYGECSKPKEELITFYDQKHTTGSNIPQAKKARGILTVGPRLKIRDLIQAAGRMRQLDKEQLVSFVIQEDIYELIKEHDPQAPLNLNTILGFALKNQVEEKVKNNFRSFKGKLQSAYEFSLLDHLFEVKSKEELKRLISSYRSELVQSETPSPYSQFHLKVEERAADEVLENSLKQFNDKVVVLSKVYNPKLSLNQESLIQKYKEVLPKALLNRQGGYEFEVETEVEQEVEVEQEIEIEVEKEESYDLRKEGCNTFLSESKFDPSKANSDYRDIFPIIQYNNNYKESNSSHLSIVPIESLLKMSNYKELSWLFNPNLFTTEALLKVTASENRISYQFFKRITGGSHEEKLSFTPIVRPFDFEMRYARHALIIKKDNEEKFRFVLLDEKNAAIIKKSPLEQLVPEGADYKITLYHMALDDFSKQGEDPTKTVNIEELKKDPLFLEFRVQMKFFSGDLDYTEEELSALERWIMTKWNESHAINRFFTNSLEPKAQAKKDAEVAFKKIISEKDYSQRHYVGSVIQKFLSPI